MAYSIIIVEDQSLTRKYFEMYLKQNEMYDIRFSLDSASVAHIYCDKYPIDLVLMDVVMKDGSNGLNAARKIKKNHPDTKIIIVTSMPEVSYIRRAKMIGVESFWYKDGNEANLMNIIERTLAGESIYPCEVADVYLGNASINDFTERELVVLRELTSGDTNKEIADRLGISANTVRDFIKIMINKTGFHSRTELAVEARAAGIVILDKDDCM